jgi:urease accessory protein
MRKILEKTSGGAPAQLAVTLAHAERQKSRTLLRLDDGSEAALVLARGSGLRDGDRLLADDGSVIAVEAALEGLSVVTSSDPLSLIRAAYHLGNRHIPVQIEALRLAYLHDHVLDDMVRALGFQVRFAVERFEPESGAYGGRGGSHSHNQHHDHDHHSHENVDPPATHEHHSRLSRGSHSA